MHAMTLVKAQTVEVIAVTYHKGAGTVDDPWRIAFSLFDRETGQFLAEIDSEQMDVGTPSFHKPEVTF